jgi:uncharacterized protein (TIGR02996 family)
VFRVVIDSGNARSEMVIEKSEIRIGRMKDNEVVVDSDRASRRHCAVRAPDGIFTLYDLDSTGGTYLRGDIRVVTGAPLVLIDEDRIEFGRFSVLVTPSEPPAIEDPVERGLLDELGRDPAARIVYADWLEARGDALRAGYLRELLDERWYDRKDALRALAARIDVRWRHAVRWSR